MAGRALIGTVLALRWAGDESERRARASATADLLKGRGAVVSTRAQTVIAVFRRPEEAVECLAERSIRPVEATAALATGELDTLASGPAVTRALHLLAIAHAGQTVVSRGSYELVADQLPAALTMRPLGMHRLADLGRADHVYQLSPAGDDVVFPPLRSLSVVPNNLAIQLTSFIGREDEIEHVLTALLNGRLTTFTGAGGCGKTRLAMHVAAACAADHADGLWVADMAPLSDAELVPSVLAAAIGVDQLSRGSTVDRIVRRLEDASSLVVLDNCEHVLRAAADLAETLVQCCPALTVLTTSREPLGVAGEHVWTVPSLAVPTSDDDAVEDVAAFRLFRDRARATRSNFRVTDHNRASIVEICRRLDGIPLAIELAAARSRTLTPSQIADQLSDRFALLTTGRGALPRQQTLEASVEWSYGLLDDAECTMLNVLSVFAGSFTLDAVEAVCMDAAPLDTLSRLVDRSLVQADHTVEPPRYRLLDTIRHYAREKLIAEGSIKVARDCHLAYYARVAVESEADKTTGAMPEVLDELERDIDNLRAAHEWSLEDGDADEGLRLVGALWNLWYTRHCGEGSQRVAASFAQASRDTAARARAAVVAADLAFYLGDVAATLSWGEQALELARSIDAKRSVGPGTGAIAWSRLAFGEPIAADAMREALEFARLTDNAWLCVSASSGLLCIAVFTGDLESARPLAEEAVAVARAHGNLRQIETALIFSALWVTARGGFDEAAAMLSEAIAIGEEIRDATFTPLARAFSASVASNQGRHDEAADIAEEAIAEAQRNQSLWAHIAAMSQRAHTEFERGALDRAGPLLDEAYALTAVVGGLHSLAAWLASARSTLALLVDDLDRAILVAEEGLKYAGGPYGGSGTGPCELALARAFDASGERERAQDLAHQALTRTTAGPFRPGRVDAIEVVASMLVEGAPDDAARLLAGADAERSRLGMPLYPVFAPQRDGARRELRERLGDEAFTAYSSEGSAMSLEGIVAYARRGRGRRTRPRHGWDSLTPTELEVVRLVTEGLRNAEICSRLFISQSTVKSHLAHVFAKLGVRSRAQLATEAARRNILRHG